MAAKNGKRADVKPSAETRRRVALAATIARKWKIRRMPRDLKKQLDKLLQKGTMHTSLQLAKWLGENGFQISRQALDDYRHKFEQQLDAVRLATAQAREVCKEFKDDDQMQTALMRLVQSRLFEILVVANTKETGKKKRDIAPTVTAVNVAALARCVSGLAKAETEYRRTIEQMRAGVAAAGKKLDEARAKGLSPEAAAQIKSVLMETVTSS